MAAKVKAGAQAPARLFPLEKVEMDLEQEGYSRHAN